MREVQIRIDEIIPKLSAVREQLARSIVRAPASGRVVGLKVFTVGGVVSAGDVLMEIVPQDRALVIEGKVSPTDADDLSPGMKTQVRFSALQERNMPILNGPADQDLGRQLRGPAQRDAIFQDRGGRPAGRARQARPDPPRRCAQGGSARASPNSAAQAHRARLSDRAA